MPRELVVVMVDDSNNNAVASSSNAGDGEENSRQGKGEMVVDASHDNEGNEASSSKKESVVIGNKKRKSSSKKSKKEKKDRKKKKTSSKKKKESGKSKKRSADDGEAETESKPPRALPFNNSDLECIVCRDFPSGKIFQCANGHLLCTSCYDRVVESAQPLCPTCRDRLPRDRRTRNRFAEQVLATVMVACSNSGCTEKLPFSKLKAHENEHCGQRIVSCQFQPIGCDWKGVKVSLDEHQASCPVRGLGAEDILKRVEDREKRLKVTEKHQRSKVAVQTKIAELLSSRCRDICIRDVVVERDEIVNDISSRPFRALGTIFELVLRRRKYNASPSPSPEAAEVPVTSTTAAAASSSSSGAAAGSSSSTPADSSSKKESQKSKIGLSLRLQSLKPHRMRLIAFLMKGPDSDIAFSPIIQMVKFTKKCRDSEMFELPLDEEQVKEMFDMGSLNVRVGLVDRRRGIARNFASSSTSMDADSSDDSSSGDDMDSMAYDDDTRAWLDVDSSSVMDSDDAVDLNDLGLLLSQRNDAPISQSDDDTHW